MKVVHTTESQVTLTVIQGLRGHNFSLIIITMK